MSSNIEVKLDVLNQKASPALYADSLALRPVASFAGRLFVDSDNPSTGIYRDTGSTWVQVADETGTIPTPTLQTVTTAGNTTTLGITVAAQSFFGTSASSSGILVVNTATTDSHIVVIGANSPSVRIRNTASLPTLNIGLGISTAVNNFIQGSVSGDYCIFNSSTTASPILFGVYNGTNTQEAARISSARNFIINSTVDFGYRLDVNGTARIQGDLTVTSGGTTINATTGEIQLQKNGVNFIRINNDTLGLRLSGNQQITSSSPLGMSLGTATYNLASNYSGFKGLNIRDSMTLNISDTPLISAVLQADSTTKGFLPPRMTTAQKNAIATPATGLVVYDSTLNKLALYTGAGWETVTSI